jgi:hypothetical protein
LALSAASKMDCASSLLAVDTAAGVKADASTTASATVSEALTAVARVTLAAASADSETVST